MGKQSGGERDQIVHGGIIPPVSCSGPLHQTVGRAIVHGAESDLERLVRNLVENAIRYTPAHGTITVTVHRTALSAQVMVRDTGVGIDATALPYLFDRFYRADSGRNRAEGGTGLGLAIAQTLARRHKGAITVESVVGEGSIFTVTLPLVADAVGPTSDHSAGAIPAWEES